MTLVVGDLIKAARDAHPTFNDRRHPDAVLLRALSRYQRELLGRLIRLDQTQAVVQLDTDLPLPDFDKGIPVYAYKYPMGAAVFQPNSDKSHDVEIVAFQDRHRYRGAVFLLDNILYLTGRSRDWEPFSLIRFYYVPEPDALPALMTTTLVYLPDSAENTLVTYLAMKMAQRGGHSATDGEQEPDAAGIAGEWKVAEERLLDESARKTQAVSSQVRDAM